MKVSEAVDRRRSTRAFADMPVDTATLVDVLARAARAPSGGNVQPWRIVLLNGVAHRRFTAAMGARLHNGGPDVSDYDIYPPNLPDPYRASRFQVGETMYEHLGIGRDDRPARLAWLARNYQFFDASAGLFCFINRRMGPPQWSDLGMYLQTVMLLLTEAGLDSCAQEAWSHYGRFVSQWFGVDDELMLFCGMAIGHGVRDHPLSAMRSERVPPERFLTVFDAAPPVAGVAPGPRVPR